MVRRLTRQKSENLPSTPSTETALLSAFNTPYPAFPAEQLEFGLTNYSQTLSFSRGPEPEASTVAFTAAAVMAMQTAITKLDNDAATGSGATLQQTQQDVVSYYNAQLGQRGYASLAAAVAGETDFNGNVAVTNIEQFYGDSSYGTNELRVAVQLAQTDWANMTNNGSIVQSGGTVYVPTIADDDLEHQQVFTRLGIDLEYCLLAVSSG